MRLLDLFCGAGGAAKGYERAGFSVLGVDIENQERYPFDFIQADAITFLKENGVAGFDAIHASPPCQKFSKMSGCRPGLSEKYPDYISELRNIFSQNNVPWIIENVPGSPLSNPTLLCGTMFGLRLYRHRLFETNFPVQEIIHPEHVIRASRAGHWEPGTIMSVSGHMAPIAEARRAMGIDWMRRAELAEAIPPAYTEFMGSELIDHLEGGRRGGIRSTPPRRAKAYCPRNVSGISPRLGAVRLQRAKGNH